MLHPSPTDTHQYIQLVLLALAHRLDTTVRLARLQLRQRPGLLDDAKRVAIGRGAQDGASRRRWDGGSGADAVRQRLHALRTRQRSTHERVHGGSICAPLAGHDAGGARGSENAQAARQKHTSIY